jgi:hypothetical protein
MELVLLNGLFSEPDNLFFGLSLFLWKGHPLANDFAARLVVFFHVRGSLAYFSERRPRPNLIVADEICNDRRGVRVLDVSNLLWAQDDPSCGPI